MPVDRLLVYQLSRPENAHVTRRVLSILSRPQYHPLAIALYCRLRSPHISEHSYLITNAVGEDDAGPQLIAFVDRSRRPETELWLNASWECREESPSESLLTELLRLVQGLDLPESVHRTGYGPAIGDARANDGPSPNDRILLCGAVHEKTVRAMGDAGLIARLPGVKEVGYHTFTFDIDTLPPANHLADDLYWGTPTPEHYPLIKSTSVIPRQDRTLAIQRSAGIFERQGDRLIAWGFIGIDGSLSTLYVVPEHRGKGLGKALMLKLLKNEMGGLSDTETSRLGYSHVAPDNRASIRMAESIGGLVSQHAVYWIRVELS